MSGQEQARNPTWQTFFNTLILKILSDWAINYKKLLTVPYFFIPSLVFETRPALEKNDSRKVEKYRQTAQGKNKLYVWFFIYYPYICQVNQAKSC